MTEVKWGKTFLLAFILLALGSLVYWNEFERKPKIEKKELESKRLFSLGDGTVSKIVVVGKAGRFTLECENTAGCKPNDSSNWKISEPEALKGDSANIDSLLSSFAGLDYQERFDLSKDDAEKRKRLLSEYGLSSERIASSTTQRVSIKRTNGEETVAYFGELHPMNDAFFVSIAKIAQGKEAVRDENAVYVVPNYIKLTFERDLTYWRDKHLFSFASPDVDRFELHGLRGKSIGTKKDSTWTVNDLPGDFETVESLLNAALQISAKTFVTEKELKDAVKFLTLELQKGDEKPVVLSLYMRAEKKKDTGKLFAKVSNLASVFEVEFSLRERLDKAPKEFRRAKLITMMERFGAKKIEITSERTGPGPIVLENKDGRWTDATRNIEIDYQKIQGLLDKLSGSQIRDFDTKEIEPPKTGAMTLKIYDEQKNLKKEFVFWDSQNHSSYAIDRLAKRKESFKMDLSVREYLPTSNDFFIPKPTGALAPKK